MSCFACDLSGEWLNDASYVIRFWKRAGFVPLYLRQTQSELTGEHTCVMVRGLNTSTDDELQWLGEFAKGPCSDFLLRV